METIKSSSEITALFDRGQRIGTPNITLIVLRNEKQHGLNGRAAFIAGKKLGNAVWRNRAKRRMRSVCQQVNGPFTGYDVVFLAKRSINSANFRDMCDQVSRALERKGIR